MKIHRTHYNATTNRLFLIVFQCILLSVLLVFQNHGTNQQQYHVFVNAQQGAAAPMAACENCKYYITLQDRLTFQKTIFFCLCVFFLLGMRKNRFTFLNFLLPFLFFPTKTYDIHIFHNKQTNKQTNKKTKYKQTNKQTNIQNKQNIQLD